MIISDKHKYVFVEYPQTGCSAVATELMANYDGRRILFKHAQYQEFLNKANAAEKEYFAFSTIRNPMDIVVSKYFKYRTNHKNYVDKKLKHGKLRKLVSPGVERRRRDFVVQNDASFEEFFLKFFTLPYSAWSIVNHNKLDFVMRFENLTQDFSRALEKIGVEPVRELPRFNKTSEKKKHFSEYYASDEAQKRAIKVFSAYMNEWEYSFPDSWGVNAKEQPRGSYDFVNFFRKYYWNYLR
ncbi:MAG: sulfotransferase family 2 domain-containing protein [Bacteroidota bacterium]